MIRTYEIVLVRALAPLALALSAILPPAVGAEETATVSGATVIVVRHAEKIDDSRDPALSEAGVERAEALAEALAHAGLDAAYASQYQRTRLTAMPAAQAAGLSVRIAPIEGDIDDWAQGFSARRYARAASYTKIWPSLPTEKRRFPSGEYTMFSTLPWWGRHSWSTAVLGTSNMRV